MLSQGPSVHSAHLTGFRASFFLSGNPGAAVEGGAPNALPLCCLSRPGPTERVILGTGLAISGSLFRKARPWFWRSEPHYPSWALSKGGGGPPTLFRPVRPWVSWGLWPPWPSWVHSGKAGDVRSAQSSLVQPWVSWGPRPPWPSWVHSVGTTILVLLKALVLVQPWDSWGPEPPWPSWVHSVEDPGAVQ